MGYRKEHGRYARMSAFWVLFGLVAYGCFSGLVHRLRIWFGESVQKPYVENLPLIGDVDLAMIITIVVLAVCGVAIHLVLNRPKSADLLIDTEAELRKVTWPTGSETWNGTVAVVITVAVMLFYLAFADFLLAELLTPIMTVGPN